MVLGGCGEKLEKGRMNESWSSEKSDEFEEFFF